MTKTLNQIFFFLHQNQNIFFSNIGNQIIFLEKKHTPPWKLNGPSLAASDHDYLLGISSNFTKLHLKMAGGVIIPYATKIFNQILKNKTIPDIFKTGILTPVLKKLKRRNSNGQLPGDHCYTSHYKTL